MKRIFKRIIPARIYRRSFIGTILSFIAVLLIMNYLLKIAQVAE